MLQLLQSLFCLHRGLAEMGIGGALLGGGAALLLAAGSGVRRRPIAVSSPVGGGVVLLVVSTLLGEQFPIVVHVAVEGFHRAAGDQPQAVGGELDQVRVVADQHDGALEGIDRLHEGLPGVDIEMVGGLVE